MGVTNRGTAGFTVRRCTTDDATTIASLGARLFSQAYGPTHPEPELSRYLARSFGADEIAKALANEDVAIFVAEGESGTPIGYALLQMTRPPFPEGVAGERPWEIYRFYVDADWHGRGVAQELMRNCLEETRSRRGDVVWLQAWQQASRALAFYQRAAFRIVGQAHFHFGDRVDDDYVLSRAP
jgi:ribosomal protein S18 acetylase RimI-like enzyme